MIDSERAWMEYVNSEVAQACEQLGMARQLRRRWTVRETPVPASGTDAYEWKIIPGRVGELPAADPDTEGGFEGRYYLLSVDTREKRFWLQHDTHHVGVWHPGWEIAEYSQITESGWLRGDPRMGREAPECPPSGWLSSHLVALLSKYGPNSFSLT